MLFSQNVVINEVMSSNNSTIQDEFENYSDWIEIYNTTLNTIDLTGYSLSDDPEEPDKWIFPDTSIGAHQFLLVFASDLDTIGNLNLHTNFKISSNGETILLSNANANIINELEVEELEQDISFGRITDGGLELEKFYVNTPGTSNNNNSVLNVLSVSPDPGFYSNQIQLSISHSHENSLIHYTLDGEEPTSNSPVYNGSLVFSSREGENFTISRIPTTVLSGSWLLQEFIWNEPIQSINLINVLRFRSFTGNLPSSDIFSGTYLIDENQLINDSIAIISIITQKENLFDYDSGIYIPGKRFDSIGWGDWHPDGNYMNNGMEWERKVHVEFYEPGGSLGFSQDCGLRIHGGWSAKMPQKSLRLTARNRYGESKFQYRIFPDIQIDRYKDFILRNSGNDFIYTHIRDAFMQELMRGLGMELQAFRPAKVFINGEYWGFHGIRERYNEDYFKRHFEIEEEDLIIIGVVGNPDIGDNSSYHSMINFIRNNSPSYESNYDSVEKMVDIPNLIDYYIAQIYYGNFDWPNNNVKMWKTTSPTSKWRFLTFDLDGGFGFTNNYEYNMLEQVVDTSVSIYHHHSTELFRLLLENNNFKEQFINRFVFHLKTTFDKNNVIDLLNEYEYLLESEMVIHIQRWNYPGSINQWKSELQILKEFAKYRPCFCKKNLMEVFELEELNFDCTENNISSNGQQFKVEINPNPAKNYVNVSVEPFDQGNYTLLLYNVSGQQILKKNVWLEKYRTKEIKIDHLNAGLYILNVTDGYSTINKKIIIE